MLASDASSRTSARTQKQDMDSPAQARSMPRLGQVKLLAQQHMSGLWYCGSRSIAETLDFATPISGNALEGPVYIGISAFRSDSRIGAALHAQQRAGRVSAARRPVSADPTRHC